MPRRPGLYRAYNVLVSAAFILLLSPLFVIIGVALFLTQGPEILYRGERLGRDRQPFYILKFRTLDTHLAAQVTATQVLPKDSAIETPLGKYLRASRLDELPQLFNVLLGHMNLVGPRPVRRQIAAQHERSNPHYGMRFTVKPGLLGHVQAFMGHGASKRLRAKMNYMLCQRETNILAELGLAWCVGTSVLKSAVTELVNRLRPTAKTMRAETVARDWHLTLHTADGTTAPVTAYQRQQIRLGQDIVADSGQLTLKTQGGGSRVIRVRLQKVSDATYKIAPASEVASHLVDRYLEDDPVVMPKPPRLSIPRDQGLPDAAAISHMHSTDPGVSTDKALAA